MQGNTFVKKEKKLPYSMSFTPTFHNKLKVNAVLMSKSASAMVEEIMGEELARREKLTERLERNLRASLEDAKAKMIDLPPNIMKVLNSYPGATSASEAAERFIRLGIKEHNAGVTLPTGDEPQPVAATTEPQQPFTKPQPTNALDAERLFS